MKQRELFCRALRRDLLVMAVGSAFGAWMAYGIGTAMSFAVGGRLYRLGEVFAVVGLIAGFTGARMLLPVLNLDPAKQERPTGQNPKTPPLKTH